MDKALRRAYGAYEVPAEIIGLLQLEEELVQEGLTMAMIGLRPLDTYISCWITPPDLIPFADTGGDGIHFGFLTEFGQIERLEEAPIVCVTPTNDPPIRLMARNIREFLDLAASVPYVEFLESWWACDEEAVMREIHEYEREVPSELGRKRAAIFGRIRERWNTKPLDVLTYMRQVRRERKERAALSTFDGLGVMGAGTKWRRYEFQRIDPPDESELARMKTFLAAASTEEKHAFIRDAIYWSTTAKDSDFPLAELLRELLLSLGCVDEAARMYEL